MWKSCVCVGSIRKCNGKHKYPIKNALFVFAVFLCHFVSHNLHKDTGCVCVCANEYTCVTANRIYLVNAVSVNCCIETRIQIV